MKQYLMEKDPRKDTAYALEVRRHYAACVSDAVVETLDLFPTLCDLTGVPAPDFVHGRTLRTQLENPSATGHGSIGHHGGRRTLRTDRWRLITHKDGYIELYDHSSPKKETLNVAEKYPDVVAKLSARLDERVKIEGATK